MNKSPRPILRAVTRAVGHRYGYFSIACQETGRKLQVGQLDSQAGLECLTPAALLISQYPFGLINLS